MAPANAYARYQENQVFTASPGQLLVMTYDGALRFLRQAKEAAKEGRETDRTYSILKTTNLLLDLCGSLNHDASQELAAALLGLYRYMLDRLVDVEQNGNLAALDEVERLLVSLRDAWAEADRSLRRAEAEAVAVGA